ncbi:MAG TPA: rod shape-determining protein MreD [Bacteroidales bacterium]|nr:rod shape-determining protein MreD [Bacteroidales bacterium]HPS26608.1 rod shape-determining protein MreD [Bacteroidales bacterium]
MTNLIFRNILRFALLILFQVLVFNNIQVFSFVTPYIYVLFILLLPFETPRWLMLVSGFVLGLLIDFFSNTGGIHTAATVLIAFLRPWAQNTVSSRQEYEPGIQPGIKNLGFRWFFLYSLILITIHHVFLFYLEVFRLAGFFQTMLHALLNVLYTLVFIIIIQYLFYRK